MRVVCIHDFATDPASNVYRNAGMKMPVINTVYTVRARVMRKRNGGLTGGYLLEEIVNPSIFFIEEDSQCELSFHVKAFRPVTDISDLIKLTKVRELEDV